MLRIDNHRQVIRYTLAVTAIAVFAPLLVVGGLLSFFSGISWGGYAIALSIAGLIPLLITPPVSYLALNMLCKVTNTLDRVDAQIRFDVLTNVLNRGYMLDQIRAAESGGVLMIIDADHFKKINDGYGHSAGDGALVIMANVISQTVGTNGLAGRLGGEEFAAFLPGTSPAEGLRTAEAICENIRSLDPLIEGHRIKMSVSIGCTMHPKTALIGKSLKLADDLLYCAKSEGRDRVAHDMKQVSASDESALRYGVTNH
jgi:diguanylate cyclase (GGDEF)-like protein